MTIGTDGYCARYTEFQTNHVRAVDVSGANDVCRHPRPNFIVVVLDDARFDGLDAMPVLQARVVADGVSFHNAFTPNAVCCPSRASILTGKYSLRHGTRTVAGAIRGADTFRESGADQQTLPVWLKIGGYTTGLFGKYLNDYAHTEQDQGPGGEFYIPPGWDRWWAFVSPEHYGGINGTSYEVVDENGVRTMHTDHSTDAEYSTDLSAQKLREFIADSVAAGDPFFAYWAPVAPHGETPGILPVPAARHAGAFAALLPWRPASWNEADVTDKPRWVQDLQLRFADTQQGSIRRALTDAGRRLQYETLLAVDEQLGLILDQLASLGVDQETVLLLTSDNGLGWGEHHKWLTKACPYEECQRVPMIARYPRRVGFGNTDAAVLNLDVTPTVAFLADVPLPFVADGSSLVDWLVGATPSEWRDDYLLENWRLSRDDYLNYSGQVTDGDRIRVYHGDPRAKPRASVLFEFDGGDGASADAVPVPIGADDDSSFSALASAVEAAVPGIGTAVNSSVNRLTILVDSIEDSVYLWEESDQGNVILPLTDKPDYLGVRDVTRGLAWVEYETGERELYDLSVDPDQLENKADDPAYSTLRQGLERRLVTLLQEIESR